MTTKGIISAGIIALITAFSHAQSEEPTKKSPEERAEQATLRMTKKLGLTAEQAEQIRALNVQFAKDSKALHEQMRQLREQQKSLREKHGVELKKTLTPEQIEEFEKIKAQKAQKRELKHIEHKKQVCPEAPKDK